MTIVTDRTRDRLPTVVFVHAHPDDEAIFTGGTIARLADRGHRVVVVVATAGEFGRPGTRAGRCDSPTQLGRRRAAETRRGCALLGVDEVEFLGYRDSGLPGDPANGSSGSFAAADVGEAADRLASILRRVDAAAVVGYDDGGIYGHPDHLQVARVTDRAAVLAGVGTRYQATVDREYLHFVATHLVDRAHRSLPTPTGIGVESVLIDTQVDVRSVLEAKRAAIEAHSSQLLHDSPLARLGAEAFAEVYGWEWFIRTGPSGPIETLDRRSSESIQR